MLQQPDSFKREAVDHDAAPPPPPPPPPDPLDLTADDDDDPRPPPQMLPPGRRAVVDNATQKAALRAAKAKAADGDFAEHFFAALNAGRQPRLQPQMALLNKIP